MPKAKKVSTKEIKKAKKAKKITQEKVEKPEIELKTKPEKYFEAVGRRKTAVARVRLFPGKEKGFLVNEKPLEIYFPTIYLQKKFSFPSEIMSSLSLFRISAKIRGGGIVAQSEALRHALSRALLKFNPGFRQKLKRTGFLTRDPRMKERKKFGLKRARRAPQWQKR